MTRRLLIIEDDPETRDYIDAGFTEAGFIVETAADGRPR